MRLTRLLERAARWADVSTRRAHQPVDISIVFESRGVSQGGQEAPEIALNWEGWANTSRLPADGVDAISVSHLDQAGRTLALALMIMGRELDY